jgi:dienelactone hydrolase
MFEYFPDNHAWSFTVLLALLSGGDINEIDDACRPLKSLSFRDDEAVRENWHDNWKKLGERLESMAARDERENHLLSAGRKYLSAANYYVVAERHVNHLDPRKLQTYHRVLDNFAKGIKLRQDAVELVEVPYRGSSLPALFIPAARPGPSPCLIHFGGGDSLKETLYFSIGQELRRRGLALLIVDNPGVGGAVRLRGFYSGPDTELPAAACVDYLETRPDVDPQRIGIVGLSLGGYYAPRAAAFEKRLKCCIARGASWEFGPLAEKVAGGNAKSMTVGAFQLMFIFGKETLDQAVAVAHKMTLEGVADKITCPLLVLHAENDRLSPFWHAEKLINSAVNSPLRKLKVFTGAEGGVEHCQADNNSLGVEYFADWAADVLGAN